MKKYFYSHLIEISTLSVELDSLDISKEEKKHLEELAESNIHHAVLDTVLSELPESKKQLFLRYLHEGKHDETWEHLKNSVENIEEKIAKTSKTMLKNLFEDIKEAKNKK